MNIPQEAISHFKRNCERKRFDVLCSLLEEGARVLDVGCGIGTYTSFPLSYLPVDVTAIDADVKTIEYASKKNNRSNLRFLVSSGEFYYSEEKFDVIVCSHILEHVIDPMKLLLNMKRLLKDDGILYVAIPNGFGSFEVQNFLPRMMAKTECGKRLIARIMGKRKDTLDDSQHVRFFTVSKIREVLEDAGFMIDRQMSDEFLGGIVFDRLLAKFPLVDRWNAVVAGYLPFWLTNGWMLICRKSS